MGATETSAGAGNIPTRLGIAELNAVQSKPEGGSRLAHSFRPPSKRSAAVDRRRLLAADPERGHQSRIGRRGRDEGMPAAAPQE